MIDLRSDTVTKPTDEMRQAMARAEVADDVYDGDPTVIRLEKMGAEIAAKEAGLFMVSGTMGNLIALLTHTRPGEEVIVGATSHIYYYETGGMARLAGLMPRLVDDSDGLITAGAVKDLLRPVDFHFPPTRLVCLENTHNRGGGSIMTAEQMREVYELAKDHNLSVHLDGARLFNAAVATGRPVADYTRYTDTVMFCLSKGLCAPMGSLLVGPADFIERARTIRKMVGGGLRQAGVVAAACIVALEKMVERLAEDHANARYLAEGLAQIPGINVNPEGVRTNIVIFKQDIPGMTGEKFKARMREKGVLISAMTSTLLRMVTHYGITRDDMEVTLAAVREVASAAQ